MIKKSGSFEIGTAPFKDADHLVVGSTVTSAVGGSSEPLAENMSAYGV